MLIQIQPTKYNSMLRKYTVHSRLMTSLLGNDANLQGKGKSIVQALYVHSVTSNM